MLAKSEPFRKVDHLTRDELKNLLAERHSPIHLLDSNAEKCWLSDVFGASWHCGHFYNFMHNSNHVKKTTLARLELVLLWIFRFVNLD